MSTVSQQVRRARRSLGLSQSSLANAAGVSLATVQNLEADRANPALSTLRSVLAPLGLEIDVRRKPADWDALVALGLPLTGEAARSVTLDADALRSHVGRAATELARDTDGPASARRRDALQGLLLAAHTHFPRVTRRWLAASPDVRALLPDPPSGRVVKLARIARRALAEYL